MEKQYQRTQIYLYEGGIAPTEDDNIESQQSLMGRAMDASSTEKRPLPSAHPVRESAIKVLVG